MHKLNSEYYQVMYNHLRTLGFHFENLIKPDPHQIPNHHGHVIVLLHLLCNGSDCSHFKKCVLQMFVFICFSSPLF